VHVGDEILACMKVPRLQHDRVPGLLQDPGDPLGPPAVDAGVATKKSFLPSAAVIAVSLPAFNSDSYAAALAA
jgi:hypothetical protein